MIVKQFEFGDFNRDLTFNTFIPDTTNADALNACAQIADRMWSDYVPFMLVGPTGCGKTHLLRAVKNKVTNRRVVYVGCDELVSQLINAVTNTDLESFYKRYYSADILLVDNLQEVFGKSHTQHELAAFFDKLQRNKIQVITAAEVKMRKAIIDGQLQQSFKNCKICEIKAPSIGLRRKFTAERAEKYNISLTREMSEIIVKQSGQSLRTIAGILKKIKAANMLLKKDIDAELIAEYVKQGGKNGK